MIDKIFRIILLQVPFVIMARAIDLLVIHFLDIQNLLFVLSYLLWALFVILVNNNVESHEHIINAIVGAITNYIIVKIVLFKGGIVMLLAIQALCVLALLFLNYYVERFLNPINVKIPLIENDEVNEELMEIINDIVENTDLSNCTSEEELEEMMINEITKRLNERNNNHDDDSY